MMKGDKVEIERDVSIRSFEITDYNGDESEVIYCEEGEYPNNPVYQVGMGKRKFIVLSAMDGGKRINRLLLSDELLKVLK